MIVFRQGELRIFVYESIKDYQKSPMTKTHLKLKFIIEENSSSLSMFPIQLPAVCLRKWFEINNIEHKQIFQIAASVNLFRQKRISWKYTVNAELEEEVDILKMDKLGQLQQIKQIYNFLTTHNLEEISKKLGLGKCPTPLSFY